MLSGKRCDGVYDDTDRCPNTPKGATVDSRGCWTLRNLKFDTNKAVIKGDGAMILDEVVGVLEKNDTLNVEKFSDELRVGVKG